MELRRRERPHRLSIWRLDRWYWRASGYGEKITRAAVVLVLLLAFFAFCYTRVEFEGGAHLGLHDAMTYAVQIAAFQKPEPNPCNQIG
jgi:hypothetical protein